MQSTDLLSLSPLLVMGATDILVMVQIAVLRRHVLTAALTVAGLALAFLSLALAAQWRSDQVTALLAMDSFALFFIGLIVLATGATALLGHNYLARVETHREEFYLLLLTAAVGAGVLAASRHFAAFFIGLEILSVALYALIAYTRNRMPSVEAGLKYLVLAAASSAFLLFGAALIYTDAGTLDFAALCVRGTGSAGPVASTILLAGIAMVVVGVGFKLALVPFHMWTGDVYQGAPAPVSAFVATVSKAAVVALLVRLFVPVELCQAPNFARVFSLLAFASMVGGNLLALRQESVKRILAYSSVAHLGYVLVAFLAGGATATTAVMFYMVAYTATVLGAFGVVSVMSRSEGDADLLDDFRGLFYRRPWLAVIFCFMLLSLAGIPLTAGFIAKFYVVVAGVQARSWWLVVTLLATSGISLYYYLRVTVALFDGGAEKAAPRSMEPIGFSGTVVLAVTTVVVLWMGCAPDSFLRLIQTAMR